MDSDNADTNVSSTRGQQDESNSKEQSHEELNKHHDKDQHEHENLGKVSGMEEETEDLIVFILLMID